MRTRWLFRIIQDGASVAGGSCPDEATARREAAHYGVQYGQDGPCTVKVYRQKVRKPRRKTT